MASRKQEKEQRRQERLAAEQEEAATDRRRKLFAGIGAAALAAVIVIVVLVVVSQSGDDGGGGDVAGADAVESELSGITDRGTLLGDPDADVTIVEFGDLQCPACKAFSDKVVPDLIDQAIEPGDANMEFRNFTIIGPESVTAAKAALAASEQNRYWNFIELFYRNQGTENSGYVTDDFLTDIARGAGVSDLDAWNEDRNNPRWDKRLDETQQQAADAGFTGTPSLQVKGPGGTQTLGTPGSANEVLDAVDQVR
jgi:protein-disulfide isomerase